VTFFLIFYNNRVLKTTGEKKLSHLAKYAIKAIHNRGSLWIMDSPKPDAQAEFGFPIAFNVHPGKGWFHV
jgi:hypothetical protein